MHRSLLFLWLGCCLSVGCQGAAPEPVRIAAAASTREAIEQLASDFQRQTGVPVSVNLGPSSELARTIERGGGADLFLSADEEWADYLAARALVEQRRDLLSNRLVVVVAADSPLVIHDLADLAGAGVRRLALAGPVVPAGRYAREALRSAGVWEKVKDRVVEGGDVRAALTYVARGEAEAGLVYATDAADTARVRVALEVKPESHSPIRYPLVLVRREPIRPAASRLYDYLGSEAAGEVFRRLGFGFLPR